MTQQEKMMQEARERGRREALALRAAAPTMTDNELIAAINRIPLFNATKDYSSWNVGGPVKDEEGNVYRLLVPHNAAEQTGTPATLTEYWQPCVYTEPEYEPTEVEQLRADVDYIAIMTGVDL